MSLRTAHDFPSSFRLDTRRLSFWLLLAAVILLPIVHRTTLWTSPEIGNSLTLKPYDLVLFLLVVVTLADALERRPGTFNPRRWSWTTKLVGATVLWMAVAALANPSWQAVDNGLGIAGAWVIVSTVRRAPSRQKTWFLVAVVVVGVFQAALGLAQSVSREKLGLGLLEEPVDLQIWGPVGAAVGSLFHRNSLAALLILAIAAAVVLAGRIVDPRTRFVAGLSVFVMSVTLPLTFSRTVLLALVPLILIAVFLLRSTGRPLAAAMVLGLAVGVFLGQDGVTTRVERTTSALTGQETITTEEGHTISVGSIDNGRRVLIGQSVAIIRDHPIVGVGPGRLRSALADAGQGRPVLPHNVVIQAAAETGVIGGALVTSLLALLALWAVRHGALAVLATVSVAPFVMLHSYPYSYDIGVLGIWIAVVVTAGATSAAPLRHPPVDRRQPDTVRSAVAPT